MNDVDPLLRSMSLHATDPDKQSPDWRISVVAGGVLWTGYIFSSGVLVEGSDEESSEFVRKYRQGRTDAADAAEYLTLHTYEAEDMVEIAQARKQNVRIPMNRIDAWWFAPEEPKRG